MMPPKTIQKLIDRQVLEHRTVALLMLVCERAPLDAANGLNNFIPTFPVMSYNKDRTQRRGGASDDAPYRRRIISNLL